MEEALVKMQIRKGLLIVEVAVVVVGWTAGRSGLSGRKRPNPLNE